jgi:hypothetical protein
MKDAAVFMQALSGDKKRKAGRLAFVVPGAAGAELVSAASMPQGRIEKIINGDNTH